MRPSLVQRGERNGGQTPTAGAEVIQITTVIPRMTTRPVYTSEQAGIWALSIV
jgi:hypothetical protein